MSTSGPFDDANEADVAEQQQGIAGGGTTEAQVVAPEDANEADVLEQGAEVSDDEDGYPHLGDEE